MNTFTSTNIPESKAFLNREEVSFHAHEFYDIINSLTTTKHTPWRQQYFLLASTWNTRYPDKPLPNTPAIAFRHYDLKPKDKQEVLELFLGITFRQDSTIPRFDKLNVGTSVTAIIDPPNCSDILSESVESHEIYDAFVLYWEGRMRYRNQGSTTDLDIPMIGQLILGGILPVATTSSYKMSSLAKMKESDRVLVIQIIEDFNDEYRN